MLERLRADFESVTGAPFQHFYCPILFREEPAELCKGHVVNEAFPESSRKWTIQRKDVDGFFGTHFEAEFVAIQHFGRVDSDEILVDRQAARLLKPQVLLDGKRIDHYVATTPDTPPQFSKFLVDGRSGPVPLVLKLHPDSTVAAGDGNWQIHVDKDLRLPALVSLLKAAHLTLFEMLGYGYALSAAGQYLGKTILGDFFLAHRGQSRDDVRQAALKHFSEFIHLVRPAPDPPEPTSFGTVADHHLHICFRGTQIPWAFLVLVKSGPIFSVVLVPTFETPVATDLFFRFLRNEEDERFEARYTVYEGGAWKVSDKPRGVVWPKRHISISLSDA